MRKYLICLLLMISVCSFAGCAREKGYAEVKDAAVKYLQQYQTELEETALAIIDGAAIPDELLDGVSYISYDAQNGYVFFGLDAQGAIGGQYWSLIYAPDGTYMGQSQTYLYFEEDGNNVQIAENVQDLWFFLWEDYDGQEDLLDIK